MKKSELTGAALNIAVHNLASNEPINKDCTAPPYSTDWAFGGPIIEREGITTAPYSTHNGVVREWKAGRDWPMSHFPYYFGPTPLIAAMRCYVASRMGEEVPDGL